MAAELQRRLGTGDAVVLGVGAMVGAGVFAVWAPAAAAAGGWLLAGLGLAAVVATCNALASAQLAAAMPRAGGTYVYGRERLGHGWGFLAGEAFVVGKTASCAAMALTAAAYALPAAGTAVQRVAAAAVIAVLTWTNCRGVTRTAAVTRVLVAVALAVLAIFVGAVVTSGGADVARLAAPGPGDDPPAYGVLQSAGLLFFAFAGYARLATLGEEVRDPARTIPRAVPAALLLVLGVYAAVGVAALAAAGPQRLAGSSAPLTTAVDAVGRSDVEPLLRVGAVVASLGALLGLLAGVSRTALAMARERDLPAALAGVDPRHGVPARAQVAVGLAAGVLVLLTDLRGALGASSAAVLLYYAVANAAAWTQPRHERRWPRALQALGLVGCLVLAAALPPASVLAAGAVLALGLLLRAASTGRDTPG